MIDAFRRSSAARITAVLPYYGYARQDRKDKPRVPISAKLVANVLSAAGTNRVLTMDLHKAQIQGFFDIPVDHLFAAPVIIDYLARLDYPNLTMVSPDAGGAERARAYAKRLDAELAIIDKRRSDDGTAEVMNVIGDVEGRTCIIQDDIIDTAGTITKAATALKANGAARVLACAVHGVLSGPAIERIEKSPIDKLIVTNTIPLSAAGAACSKIVVLSVARLLGQAIKSIHEETSVSSLVCVEARGLRQTSGLSVMRKTWKRYSKRRRATRSARTKRGARAATAACRPCCTAATAKAQRDADCGRAEGAARRSCTRSRARTR